MVAAGAQQLVARRHLHENGDVAPGTHGHADERHPQAENLVVVIVEPEPLVGARGPTVRAAPPARPASTTAWTRRRTAP